MKQFLKYTLATVCGLLIFCCISSFFFFMIMGAVVALSESSVTVVKPNSVYTLELNGTLTERSTEDEFSALFAEAAGQAAVKNLGLEDVLANIEKAKNDSNIVGIYLKGGSLSGGYASFATIREALEDFRTSGKWIIAYAENYTQGNYYLASVADKVYCNAHGSLGWSGLYAGTMFFSRALEKVGVEMQVLKVGTFKSAVEPYILTEMSDANRLQMEVLLGDMWGEMTADISTSRGLSVETLNVLADKNMMLQPEEELVTTGLVDSLIYQQDMQAVLAAMVGTKDYTLLSHTALLNTPEKAAYKADKIAVLYAEGEITDSEGDGIVGTKLVKEINKLADKDEVKAVVLRVNSPGGSAAASEQIWHALTLLKEKKPLIVSMGDYAASGGYYISCLADTILAEANTLTGSIGIFGLVPNVKGLTNKLGIDIDGVGTNALSDLENNMVYKGMNKTERQLMQGMINRGYELFVKRCADGRKVSIEDIKAVAEGRVWSGKRAVELGLVDALGNTQDAIEIAARMAGVTDYAVSTYPAKKDKLTELLESLTSTSETEKTLLKIKKLTEKPTVMARLPYNVTIE